MMTNGTIDIIVIITENQFPVIFIIWFQIRFRNIYEKFSTFNTTGYFQVFFIAFGNDYFYHES